MKKYAYLALVFFAFVANSCYKNSQPPLSYGVEAFANKYINYNDTLHIPVEIKFFTGNTNEEVTIFFTGMPSGIRLDQDTIKGLPTFTADFVLRARDIPLGTYPVTMVIYSQSTGYKYYPFNLGVIHENCAQYLVGSYTGYNTCQSAMYNYTVTTTSPADSIVDVVNLGGYGTNTATRMVLDCNTDSVYIPLQNIGNGVSLRGSGHFESNKIVIRYKAFNTPGGFDDSCSTIMYKL